MMILGNTNGAKGLIKSKSCYRYTDTHLAHRSKENGHKHLTQEGLWNRWARVGLWTEADFKELRAENSHAWIREGLIF